MLQCNNLIVLYTVDIQLAPTYRYQQLISQNAVNKRE
jgi:hypothetical protein